MHSQQELLSIYDRNRDDLVRFSASIVGDLSAAEDVLQEAWRKFVRAAAEQHFAEPLAYLRTLVRTLSLDARRRMQRDMRRSGSDALDETELPDQDRPGPEQTAIARNELAQLQAALEELQEMTRQALLLYWRDGKCHRDVSDALEISLGQTHKIVRDGLDHCRRKLSRPGSVH